MYIYILILFNSMASSVDSMEDEEDWEANLNQELEELHREKDSLMYLNSG